MPLEFSPLEIPYGQLDTHTDPTALEPGTLTTADNVSSQVDGRYSKRFGMTQISTASTETPIRLVRRGLELAYFDTYTLWKYILETGTWAEWSAPIPRATPTDRYIALEQSKDFTISTRATASSMTLHAFIDASNGNVVFRVFSTTDESLVAGTTDSTSIYDIVHAVALSTTTIAIFYSSSTDQVIRYRTFNPVTRLFSAVTNYLSAANVFAGTVAYPYSPFDICAFNSTDVTLAWATDAPAIKVVRRNVLAHSDSYAAVTLSTEEPDGGFAVGAASATVGAVSFHSASAGAVRFRGFNPTTGAALYALTTLNADSAAGTNWNIGITSTSSTTLLICFDRRKVTPAIGSTITSTVTNAGAITGGTVNYNQWPAGKPYSYAGKQYLPVIAPFDTQDTYFVLDVTPDTSHLPVAMHAFRTAYHSGVSMACLPDADAVSPGVYAFDAPTAYKFLSNSSTKAAVTTFTVDYTDPKRFLFTEMGDSTYMTGGLLFGYDGQNVIENNFLLYPEIVSATAGAVGGGGLDDGTYSYIVVYEVSDHNGNIDRSTTSLPMSAVTSAGAGLGKVTLVISSLNTSYRIFNDQPAVASVFRTEAGGDTYYHVRSVAVGPSLETITVVDSTPDTVIINNRIIYTQGGVLDREPPLPAHHTVNFNNRLWGCNGKTVFYSGDYVPGENPWFSTLQRFVIDPGGDITALASLDEKLIIFKEDRIFKVSGRGGNAQGTGSDLTPPSVITADAGCIDPRSIVVIPQGVMFQSAKGIYMLTRGEELTFIGMPVDRYMSQYPNVTSAVMMPEESEVRFQVTDEDVENGVVLVYNYRDNRWTTHSNFAADYTDSNGNPVAGAGTSARVDSLIANGAYHTVDWHGFEYLETDGFRDIDSNGNEHYVVSELETGWIKPAGKQGLVRCQRILFLNEFLEDHDMDFEVDKDYVDSSVQSASYTAADIASLPQEQVSLHVQDQQGEAWRVRMRDSESDGANSEGYRAKGVTFLVGAKRGTIEKNMQAGAKA